MPIRAFILSIAACASLVACGQSLGDQAIGGGAIGAGAAVIAGHSALQGAAIGAAGNIAYCQLNPGKCY